MGMVTVEGTERYIQIRFHRKKETNVTVEPNLGLIRGQVNDVRNVTEVVECESGGSQVGYTVRVVRKGVVEVVELDPGPSCILSMVYENYFFQVTSLLSDSISVPTLLFGSITR